MSDFKESLFEEQEDLRGRIDGLKILINSPSFNSYSARHKDLLKDHLFVMDKYDGILSDRIELLNDIEESETRDREYQGMCEENEQINYAGSMAGY